MLKLIHVHLASLLVVTSCAGPSGVRGLQEDAFAATMVSSKSYEGLARCVVEELEQQPGGLGSVALPPDGWRQISNISQTEVYNSNYRSGPFTEPGRYGYYILFVGQGDGSTIVDILARKSINPFLPASYALNVVNKALEPCL